MSDLAFATFFMLASITAQPVEPPAPTIAQCETAWSEAGRGRWTQSLECPDDVPDAAALQALADEHMPGAVRRLARNEVVRPGRQRIAFVYTEGGWRLRDTTRISIDRPRPIFDALEAGVSSLCIAAVELGADGRASGEWVACRTFGPDTRRNFAREYEHAFRRVVRTGQWLVPRDAANPCAIISMEFVAPREEGGMQAVADFPEPEQPSCSTPGPIIPPGG